MPKTITVNCEFCGKPTTKELKEYTRKIKNGKRFFCDQSCGAQFKSKKRKEEKEAALPPETTMTRIIGPARSIKLRQVIMMQNDRGEYMPYDWVNGQIGELYPELSGPLPSKTIDKWRDLCNQIFVYFSFDQDAIDGVASISKTAEESLLEEDLDWAHREEYEQNNFA